MNSNKKWNIGLAVGMVISTLLGSCAKFETRDFYADKPQSLIDQEVLDAYQDLKTYVNYDNQPHFKLSTALQFNDLANNNALYRLMQQHFDEVSLTTDLNHFESVQDDGTIVVDTLEEALEVHAATDLSIHMGHLVWHEEQAANYLNNLVADIIIPGETGTEILFNFEEDDLNNSYPVLGDGSARIISDPDGESGQTLRIEGSQTFPQFEVNLPEELTLGNCKSVTIDFKGDGCCGLYGQGMRMGISTSLGSVSLGEYDSPAGYGAPTGDVWFRNGIILPIADLELSNAQKELTSFVLTIGSATGSADYLIDNISIQWEKIGEEIIKTPEEKAEIFTGELNNWIAAIAEDAKDRVNSWSVVYQPMDDDNPSELRSGAGVDELPANVFYWQDYLGKDYASIAIGIIKEHANTSDKIYITETGLLDNTAKIQGLIDFIDYTDQQGKTVDGIVVELPLNITDDKTAVETMLTQLASSNKLIKISLDIGTGTTISQATTALYQQQAAMYKWFVETYYQIVPADQRGGIIFRSPTDRVSSETWRPNQPVGLFTNSNGYQRKPAYVGVVEALQNQ